VRLARRRQSPRFARADRVERQLHVLAQLGRAARAAGLVIDELVATVRQAVHPVHAATQRVRAHPEGERPLEPQRLARLAAEALEVAPQRALGLAVQLVLLIGRAEAPAPPAGLEQPEELVERAPIALVIALEHLVDEDPEALVERRLARDAEDPREL